MYVYEYTHIYIHIYICIYVYIRIYTYIPYLAKRRADDKKPHPRVLRMPSCECLDQEHRVLHPLAIKFTTRIL